MLRSAREGQHAHRDTDPWVDLELMVVRWGFTYRRDGIEQDADSGVAAGHWGLLIRRIFPPRHPAPGEIHEVQGGAGGFRLDYQVRTELTPAGEKYKSAERACTFTGDRLDEAREILEQTPYIPNAEPEEKLQPNCHDWCLDALRRLHEGRFDVPLALIARYQGLTAKRRNGLYRP